MKAIKYIAFSALLSIGLVACSEKPVEYTAAEPVGNAEVYFPTGQASDFNLKTVTGNIEIQVNRVDKEGQLNVPITIEATNPAFTAPASVSFAAGQASAKLEISVDRSKLEEAVVDTVSITIADQITPYGNEQFTFTASIPAAWMPFKKANITEEYWGEEHQHTIYIQDKGDYVLGWIKGSDPEKCSQKYDDGTGCAGGIWGTGEDFYFTWYKNIKNADGYEVVQVEPSYLYTNSNYGPVYAYDYFSFFVKYNAANSEGFDANMSFTTFAEKYASRLSNMSYYDGNGGFVFNFMYSTESLIPGGQSFTAPEFDVVAICEGFVRTTDYNDDKHFGAADALFDGTMSSGFFSQDGGKTGFEFEQTLFYNSDYELDEDPAKYPASLPTTYYLENFFTEGYSLAFTADVPEILKDGAAISDVANEQKTGLFVFGAPIYVNIKKGSVSFPENAEFPTFNFQLHVYTKDEEGNVLNDYGVTEESFSAEAQAKTAYFAEDFTGVSKKSFIGTFGATCIDFWDGTEFYLPVTIADAGKSAAGEELLTIKGLAGLNGFDDSVTAVWEEGFVFLDTPQTCADFIYQGANHDVTFVLGDPFAMATAHGVPLILGYVAEDDVFAIAGHPKYPNYCATFFSSESLGGGISASYNWVIGVEAPASLRSTGRSVRILEAECADLSAPAAPKASARRTFSLSPVQVDRTAKKVKDFVLIK